MFVLPHDDLIALCSCTGRCNSAFNVQWSFNYTTNAPFTSLDELRVDLLRQIVAWDNGNAANGRLCRQAGCTDVTITLPNVDGIAANEQLPVMAQVSNVR